jgi:hypothetical protein
MNQTDDSDQLIVPSADTQIQAPVIKQEAVPELTEVVEEPVITPVTDSADDALITVPIQNAVKPVETLNINDVINAPDDLS